jgi:hypothetical protein
MGWLFHFSGWPWSSIIRSKSHPDDQTTGIRSTSSGNFPVWSAQNA